MIKKSANAYILFTYGYIAFAFINADLGLDLFTSGGGVGFLRLVPIEKLQRAG